MIKQAALALFLIASLPACQNSNDNNRAPGPVGSRTTNPDKTCNKVCKNLLAECGVDGEAPSLALDSCSLDCQEGLFSTEEMTCLSDLTCNESSDACLEE
jgi:hypothetical protein